MDIQQQCYQQLKVCILKNNGIMINILKVMKEKQYPIILNKIELKYQNNGIQIDKYNYHMI